MKTETTSVCVVGGGPAGMMAGLLLARQGVDVIVLEKHADFLRDFRGDTIHPATLRLLDELGLLEEFLALPHTKMTEVTMDTPDGAITFADFRRLGRYGYVAFVPQWDFLDFVAEHARRRPSFRLVVRAEVEELLEEDGRVVGVRAKTPEGPLEVRATLVLGADGRHSTVRRRARLEIVASSPPADVLWFRIGRRPDDSVPFFRKSGDRVIVCVNRGGYWQIAYVIPHGGLDALRARGLESFRQDVAAAAPALADRTHEIASWDAVKLLSVRVDRLRRWYRPGLLCIGDAAHAMSPAGGVGINLAIQDAVAAANVLGPAFRASGAPTLRDLARVQKRRELPTRLVQAFQLRALRDLYPGAPTRGGGMPFVFRLVRRIALLRHLAGWFIGMGVRTERLLPAAA